MDFKLFAVNCKNKDCGHTFVTNSTEHTNCPSCDGEIVYTDDYILATSNDVFSSDIESLMVDKESILAGILIALSYINNDNTIARFQDNYGFELNIKKSEYTDKLLNSLGIRSIPHLEDLVEEHMDAHEALIINPVFEFIERNYYYDKYNDLYESGHVKNSLGKKFYNWILANTSYVADILKR